MDQPFVDYNSNKDEKKHNRAEMDDLVMRWEEKRKANGGSMMKGWTTGKTDELL